MVLGWNNTPQCVLPPPIDVKKKGGSQNWDAKEAHLSLGLAMCE